MGSVFTSVPVLSRSSCFKFIIDYENLPVNTCQICFWFFFLYFTADSCSFAPCSMRVKLSGGSGSRRLGLGVAGPGGEQPRLSPLTVPPRWSGEGFRRRLCSPTEPPPHSSPFAIIILVKQKGKLCTIWIMLTIAYLELVFSPPSFSPGPFLLSEIRLGALTASWAWSRSPNLSSCVPRS